jgi:hypothetical protein
MRISHLMMGICLIAGIPGIGLAEEWTWGGTIGGTYWMPEWDHELQGFDAETSGLFGPVAFIHYGRIGFGIQYYTGSFDVKFGGSEETFDANRNDLDLMLSYRIGSIFQLSLLYKEIQFDWKQIVKVENKIKGLGLGAGATKVFQSGILLYGFGFYMPDLDYSQTISHSGSIDFDSDGLWIEGGGGYRLAQAHLLFKLGYRYQKISAEGRTTDWSETTRGPRAELSYYF